MNFERDFAGGLLSVTSSDAIGTITIKNPDRKNAVTAAMWRAIPQAVRFLTDEAHAHVLVLRGVGTDFSAGADIREFDRLRKDAETAVVYEASNSEAFTAIRQMCIRDSVYIAQFNEPAAGQTVFHLHFHVIPRHEGVALKPHSGKMEDGDVLADNAKKIIEALR